MHIGLIKGHVVSVIASLIASMAIVLGFFGWAQWVPAPDQQMFSDFAASWVLLTYLWIQLSAHIVLAPATKNEMLVDMLSSVLPVILIFYVLAEYYRNDLQLSAFQINAAWLTAYAMLLDLVIDTGLAISLRRQV